MTHTRRNALGGEEWHTHTYMNALGRAQTTQIAHQREMAHTHTHAGMLMEETHAGMLLEERNTPP